MHADFYRVYIKITHEDIKTAIVRANNIKFIKKLTNVLTFVNKTVYSMEARGVLTLYLEIASFRIRPLS